MENPGKRFERKFKASIPDGIFCMRIPDKTFVLNGRTYSEETEADFIATDGEDTWLIECKSTCQKSLRRESVKPHQVESLRSFDALGGRTHGLLAVEFYDKEGYRKPKVMFLLPISEWIAYGDAVPTRASMPISAFRRMGREIEYKDGRYLL